MKKLLVFGDSWPFGSELENYQQDCFPALMEEILKIPVENNSLPGTSIDHMVHKFLDLVKKDQLAECGILFCLTGISRSMIFKGNTLKEIHPSRNDIESETYYAYIFSWELAEFNFLKNCLLVQYICKTLKIPLYFVTNWYDVPESPLLDKSNFYSKSLIEIFGIDSMKTKFDYFWSSVEKNEYFYPNKYHPNEKGHRLIAKELSEWINSR